MLRAFAHPIIWILIVSFVSPSNVRAADTLNPEDFVNAAVLLAGEAAKAVIEGVAYGGDYRTFQGVNGPTGLVGLDVGVSVMASQVPPSFLGALENAGYKKPKFAAIPAPHVRISKSLGDWLSADIGYAKYKEFKLMGAGIQAHTSVDEGPDFAFRVGYSRNNLGIVKTQTISPSIMVGKKLSFFEPYLGVAYQIASGQVSVPLTFQGATFTAEAEGESRSMLAYTGIVFNFFLLQIAFEGNYSKAGVSGVGAKVGLRF